MKTARAAYQFKCNFCNTEFWRKRIATELQCPKCREYDVEPTGKYFAARKEVIPTTSEQHTIHTEG